MKEFIELQSVEWQKIYAVLKTLNKQDVVESETLSQLKTVLLEVCDKLTDTDCATLANKLINNFKQGVYSNVYTSVDELSKHPEESLVVLSEQDLNYLSKAYLDTPDDMIISLLIAFTIYYRKNYHPSNWIHYDRKTIFYLGNILKKSISDQNVLTNYLHTHYNLNMQVVGSKQPIPCFSLTWCNNQHPVAGEPGNTWIEVGTFTPTTVANVLKLIKEPNSKKER